MKVISVVGYKKSGKTALVSALVRQLSGFGTVGTVKHMGEQRLNPGETDTGRHFDAGADMVVGITGSELVSFARDASLENALDMLCDRGLDFAVVEGFKDSNLPKIVIGDLEGVSNIVFRVPADIDPHEELTASLVGMTLAQPDRYTPRSPYKESPEKPGYQESRGNRHFYRHRPRAGRRGKDSQARVRKIRTRSLKGAGQNPGRY